LKIEEYRRLIKEKEEAAADAARRHSNYTEAQAIDYPLQFAEMLLNVIMLPEKVTLKSLKTYLLLNPIMLAQLVTLSTLLALTLLVLYLP
jgi:hypothetical protein